MSKRVERAVELFEPGKCSCSQAVTVAFASAVGFDETAAMNAARGFGGGIAMHGLTCGAVTGAVMTLGIRAAQLANDEKEAKTKAYEMVRRFTERFKERHGTIECKGLIGVDLSTEEGRKLNSDMKITRRICPDIVRSAAEIVEELL
ncbi:MAG: C-GCAxxG-C-C family protein [Rhodospirillales bacterium]|jgi:C_GCAxxG_C_C family probable redox protein|nr:C-GCAxxG-C-C family protein [Rhodospirillales bacterium]